MEISLNLDKTKHFNKHYKFCVGSCHASMALRKDYFDQLKFIHDTLGIERVRFHGIFNDDMQVVNSLSSIFPLPGSERFKEYNFESIAKAYDNVLEAGMEPFVELGFMPSLLASNLNQKILFYYGGNSSMPKDDDEWKNFIKAFINFLIARYGKEKVEKWYFEVWNEPDLIVFFGGSKEDYFHLYEITVRAIKEVDPLIKVGGPSTSGSKWIKDFVEFIEKNNLPCDFISTHQYAGDPIGKIEGQDLENKNEEEENPFSNPLILKDVPSSTVLDGLRHVFIDKTEIIEMRNDTILINSKECKKQAKGRPLYYTEWNENATFSAYTNDTRKVASFIVMTSLKMEENVSGSSIWCFSDLFEELHRFKEEFHGGFGLLTHNGIPKPSYYAMRFLLSVGNERFIIPEDYKELTIGAFKNDKGDVELLITRQNMKNLDLPKMEVKISLNCSASKITKEVIDEESGNPFKIYKEMNSPEYLLKNQIDYIKEKSKVIEEEMEFISEENKTSFFIKIGINDVYLIRIYK